MKIQLMSDDGLHLCILLYFSARVCVYTYTSIPTCAWLCDFLCMCPF